MITPILGGGGSFVDFLLDATSKMCPYAMMDPKTEEFLCDLRSPLNLCWPDECPAFTGPWGEWRGGSRDVFDL